MVKGSDILFKGLQRGIDFADIVRIGVISDDMSPLHDLLTDISFQFTFKPYHEKVAFTW